MEQGSLFLMIRQAASYIIIFTWKGKKTRCCSSYPTLSSIIPAIDYREVDEALLICILYMLISISSSAFNLSIYIYMGGGSQSIMCVRSPPLIILFHHAHLPHRVRSIPIPNSGSLGEDVLCERTSGSWHLQIFGTVG